MNGKKLYNLLSVDCGVNTLIFGNKPITFFQKKYGEEFIAEDFVKVSALDLGQTYMLPDCETMYIRTV